MARKEVLPIGRRVARRVVGVDPKNMTTTQRDTMIGYHMGDIRRALLAGMYTDVAMFASRIEALAELNHKEQSTK
jgi:hypothetical protein